MTKNEKDELDQLCRLQYADMRQKERALYYVKTYINKNALFCLTCGSAVKIMFNQLKQWWGGQNQDNYRKIKSL